MSFFSWVDSWRLLPLVLSLSLLLTALANAAPLTVDEHILDPDGRVPVNSVTEIPTASETPLPTTVRGNTPTNTLTASLPASATATRPSTTTPSRTPIHTRDPQA